MLFYAYTPDGYTDRFSARSYKSIFKTEEKKDLQEKIKEAHEKTGETALVKLFHTTFPGFRSNATWYKMFAPKGK